MHQLRPEGNPEQLEEQRFDDSHTESLDAKCSYQKIQGHNEMTRSLVRSANGLP